MKTGPHSSHTALFLWSKLAIRYNRVLYTSRLAAVWQWNEALHYTNGSIRLITHKLQVRQLKKKEHLQEFHTAIWCRWGFNAHEDSHCLLLDDYTLFSERWLRPVWRQILLKHRGRTVSTSLSGEHSISILFSDVGSKYVSPNRCSLPDHTQVHPRKPQAEHVVCSHHFTFVG